MDYFISIFVVFIFSSSDVEMFAVVGWTQNIRNILSFLRINVYQVVVLILCVCFLVSFLPSVIQTGWLVLHRDVTISRWENQTPPSASCSHLGLYKFGPVVLRKFNESSVTSKASPDCPLPPFSPSPAFDLPFCMARYSLPGIEFCVIYFVITMCLWDLECD